MTAAGLHLIVRVAGERIALPAAELDSVVEIDAPTPVPRAPPHVVGLAALRSRVLTVIDARAALGLPATGVPTGGQAVMLEHEGHGYALLVEVIEDAIAIAGPLEPLRAAPAAGWAQVARGIVTHDGVAMMAITPRGLVAGLGAPAA